MGPQPPTQCCVARPSRPFLPRTCFPESQLLKLSPQGEVGACGNPSGAAKDWMVSLKLGIPLVPRTEKLVLIGDSPCSLTSTTKQVFFLTPG